MEAVDGVKGVFEASGQLQVIFGTGTVNKVFDEFIKEAGIEAGTKDDVKAAAAQKQNFFLRLVKTLGDVFVPIIPAIVASGLMMGLVEGIGSAIPAFAESDIYSMLDLFANAAFTFLPILIAISAAKVFGANIYLGAVIGMIMVHPNLTNAWSAAEAIADGTMKTWSIFGLYTVNQVGYQGHVIPVVIAIFVLSRIEKKLHKVVPEMIDLFVTPLVSVMVTAFLTMAVIGPIFGQLETWVLSGVQWLITIPYGLGAMIVGGVYAITVVAGLHHMYNAIEAEMIAANGKNIWMPIATAANVAQGGAALAIALKTKNKKIKEMALPASLSAFLGITEPAIFGVNVRYQRPFIAGLIGGAAGAMVGSITGVYATAYGITGLFGFLITTDSLVGYALDMAVAFVVSFGISWILGLKPEDENPDSAALEAEKAAEAIEENPTPAVEKDEHFKEVIPAPMDGIVMPVTEAPDETFASEALGKGIAVDPDDGTVRAPFDGSVLMLFDTGHAIAIRSDMGVEVLIHVGLDTVGLGGKPFSYKVEDQAHFHKGDVLMTADLNMIREAGLKTVTPMVVTNVDDFASVTVENNCIVVEK
ncbi:MAG: glucose PTS transporter subunit IIA [Lachnospiraceae bacterium]